MEKTEPSHGSYRMYFKFKCRCTPCRTYQNERVARNRKDRLESGRLSHRTRSAYDAGCRCEDCRLARSEAGSGREYVHNHPFDGTLAMYGSCRICDDIWVGTQ